ncbi:Eukaryotic translation initiation factor eIF-1 [Tulasnella sp. JGI-2019a]|nr:Eukaryotic translation initiation factor eIF-1 [Tulasnella sp. JGI-2019a]
MNVQNLNNFDPFAEEGDLLDDDSVGAQNYLHIRVQQRNGRKTLTTLQGLPKGAPSFCMIPPYRWSRVAHTMRLFSVEYDPKKLLKAFKKVRQGMCPRII